MVASNRFLPNFGRAPAIRGGAPLPQERPYDLGEGADRVAEAYPRRSSAEMTRLASEALARHPVDPRYVDISPDTEPPRVMAARLRAQEARDCAPSRGIRELCGRPMGASGTVGVAGRRLCAGPPGRRTRERTGPLLSAFSR